MAKWHKLRTPLIIVSIISALSCLFVYTYELQKTSLQSETDLPLSYEENEAVASALQKTKTIVTVGIYPLEVYDIDFQRNTYKMTAYVWLSWYTNELVAENNLAPPSTFEIMNSVDSWDFKKTELISDTMSNGKSYYLMKIDGMFFQNFDVSRYPMDRQKLTITFEDGYWLENELIYIPDMKDTRLQDEISVPGWKINRIEYNTNIHKYGSKFGYEDEEDKYAYSQLSFNIYIERPLQFFIFKFVFPLAIILLFSLLALWMPINQFEVRIALSGSSLLNLVFLQQVFNDKIITTRQIVLMDLLYIWAYSSVIFTLVELIYSHYQHINNIPEPKIMSRNRLSFIVHATVFVILVLYAIISGYL